MTTRPTHTESIAGDRYDHSMPIEELEVAFDARRPEFTRTHEGLWALFFDDGAVHFFELENDAVSSGLRDRSGRAFIVKRALLEEPVVMLSAVVLNDQAS